MLFFQELMNAGGVVMWAILACSIAGVFIILDRLLQYHRAQIDVPEFLQGLFNILRRSNVVEAIAICDDAPGPVAHVLRAAILHGDRDEAALRRAVEEASLAELPKLEKRLKALATIAQVTPLLGLLGTVLGMIGAFQAIQDTGAFVSTSDLAKHIWKALLTTAAGLTVSIPCYAFYNFLVARVESLALDMEKAGSEIIYFLGRNKINLDAVSAMNTPGGSVAAGSDEAENE